MTIYCFCVGVVFETFKSQWKWISVESRVVANVHTSGNARARESNSKITRIEFRNRVYESERFFVSPLPRVGDERVTREYESAGNRVGSGAGSIGGGGGKTREEFRGVREGVAEEGEGESQTRCVRDGLIAVN